MAVWRSLVPQGKELREVAQRIVQAAAELIVPAGYTRVESMITIDEKMPIKFRVLEQANQLRFRFKTRNKSSGRY